MPISLDEAAKLVMTMKLKASGRRRSSLLSSEAQASGRRRSSLLSSEAQRSIYPMLLWKVDNFKYEDSRTEDSIPVGIHPVILGELVLGEVEVSLSSNSAKILMKGRFPDMSEWRLLPNCQSFTTGNDFSKLHATVEVRPPDVLAGVPEEWQVLENQSDALPQWVAQMHDADNVDVYATVRAAAANVQWLHALCEAGAIEPLVLALQSDVSEIRIHASVALGRLSHSYYGCQTLRELHAIPSLVSLLQHRQGPPESHLGALSALTVLAEDVHTRTTMADAGVIEALLQLLMSHSDHIYGQAGVLFGQLSMDCTPKLEEHLNQVIPRLVDLVSEDITIEQQEETKRVASTEGTKVSAEAQKATSRKTAVVNILSRISDGNPKLQKDVGKLTDDCFKRIKLRDNLKNELKRQLEKVHAPRNRKRLDLKAQSKLDLSQLTQVRTMSGAILCGTLTEVDQQSGHAKLVLDNNSKVYSVSIYYDVSHIQPVAPAWPVYVRGISDDHVPAWVSVPVPYSVGTELMVIAEGGLVRAVVKAVMGAALHPMRHTLNFDDGSMVDVDLNPFNHCVSLFSSVEEYCNVANAYCKHLHDFFSVLEDSITGAKLQTADQVLSLSMFEEGRQRQKNQAREKKDPSALCTSGVHSIFKQTEVNLSSVLLVRARDFEMDDQLYPLGHHTVMLGDKVIGEVDSYPDGLHWKTEFRLAGVNHWQLLKSLDKCDYEVCDVDEAVSLDATVCIQSPNVLLKTKEEGERHGLNTAQIKQWVQRLSTDFSNLEVCRDLHYAAMYVPWRRVICEVGAVEPLVLALKSPSLPMIVEAAQTLACLTLFSAGREAAVHCRAIIHLLPILHSPSTDAQLGALNTCINLAEKDENGALIVQAEFIEPLVDLVVGSSSSDVCSQALVLLKLLCQTEDQKAQEKLRSDVAKLFKAIGIIASEMARLQEELIEAEAAKQMACLFGLVETRDHTPLAPSLAELRERQAMLFQALSYFSTNELVQLPEGLKAQVPGYQPFALLTEVPLKVKMDAMLDLSQLSRLWTQDLSTGKVCCGTLYEVDGLSAKFSPDDGNDIGDAERSGIALPGGATSIQILMDLVQLPKRGSCWPVLVKLPTGLLSVAELSLNVLHSVGTSLQILHHDESVTATVKKWIGDDLHAARYVVTLEDSSEVTTDLNVFNHLSATAPMKFCSFLQSVTWSADTHAQGSSGTDASEADNFIEVTDVVRRLQTPKPWLNCEEQAIQPVLIVSDAGTGKTWSAMKMMHILSGKFTIPYASDGAKRTHNDTVVPLVPVIPALVMVQQLVQVLSSEPKLEDLFDYFKRFLDSPETDHRTWLSLLQQAFQMRTAVIVLDGIDEAAGKGKLVWKLVKHILLPMGLRVIATTRPEGLETSHSDHFMGLSLNKQFHLLRLRPLSSAQQLHIVMQQLQVLKGGGREVAYHLMKFSNIRKQHDQLWNFHVHTRSERLQLEQMEAPDLFVLRKPWPKEAYISSDGVAYDPAMRQMWLDGNRLIRVVEGPIKSKHLRNLNQQLSPILPYLDDVLTQTPEHLPREELEVMLAQRCRLHMSVADDDLKLASKLGSLMQKLNVKGPAEVFWGTIMTHVDEIYQIAEMFQPLFHLMVDHVLRSSVPQGNTRPDVMFGGLKDPVRIYEKAKDDYASRFPEGLAEACVVDVLRVRMVCSHAGTMLHTMDALCKTATMWVVQLDDGSFAEAPPSTGKAVQLACIRLKNKCAQSKLDPTHFRNVLFNGRLSIGNAFMFVEIQIHHHMVLEFNHQSDAHAHYDFFRAQLGHEYGQLDEMLERMFRFFDDIKGVPILLSLLVILFNYHNFSFSQMPTSLYELYQRGIIDPLPEGTLKSMVQRLAVANHIAKRRTFSPTEVKEALLPEEWELWNKLQGNVPLVKLLGDDETGDRSLFQFKHLSFQEALFADALIKGIVPTFWKDGSPWWQDEPYYKHAFEIGGERLLAIWFSAFVRVLRPTKELWNMLAETNRLKQVCGENHLLIMADLLAYSLRPCDVQAFVGLQGLTSLSIGAIPEAGSWAEECAKQMRSCCPKLSVLKIDGWEMRFDSSSGLTLLEHCQAKKHVVLPTGCPIRSVGATFMATFYDALEALTVADDLPAAVLGCLLAHASLLRSLTIMATGDASQGSTSQTFSKRHTRDKQQAIRKIAPLAVHLHRLVFGGDPIVSGWDAEAISCCTALTSLQIGLSKNITSQQGAMIISKCSSINTLQVGAWKLSSGSTQPLHEYCRGLQLASVPQDAVVLATALGVSLLSLTLDHNVGGGDGILEYLLQRHPAVHEMRLYTTVMTTRILHMLAQHCLQLTSLEIGPQAIRASDLELLAKQCCSLRHLVLGPNGLSAESCKALAMMDLTSLAIGTGNCITGHGLQVILLGCQHLVTLAVGDGNGLGLTGAQAILHHGQRLLTLRIAGWVAPMQEGLPVLELCKIMSVVEVGMTVYTGADGVIAALTLCPALTSVHLGESEPITDEVMKCLGSCANLTSLFIRNKCLVKETMLAFITMRCTRLTSVHLGECKFVVRPKGDRGMHCIPVRSAAIWGSSPASLTSTLSSL